MRDQTLGMPDWVENINETSVLQPSGKPLGGRRFTTSKGCIQELKKLIPTFKLLPFQIGGAVNEYLNLVVREPLDDPGLVNSKSSVRIPVAAVSNGYLRSSFRGRKQGYKLVQHHQMLDDILESLEKFSNNEEAISTDARFQTTPLKASVPLEGKLTISEYGARLAMEIFVPNYKFDYDDRGAYTLKIRCANSVDGYMALRINLFLFREDAEESDEILIATFHKNHDQDLEDSDIRDFFRKLFHLCFSGDWIKLTIPAERFNVWIENYFPKLQKRIQKLYKELVKALSEAESYVRLKEGEINLFLFYQTLSILADEQETLHLRQQIIGKILKVLQDVEDSELLPTTPPSEGPDPNLSLF